MKKRLRAALYVTAHIALVPANVAFRLPASMLPSPFLARMCDHYDQFHIALFDWIDPDGSINDEVLARGW